MNYETIRINFLRGLWTGAMVQVALRKGVITTDQYKDILASGVAEERITAAQYQSLTGEAYTA